MVYPGAAKGDAAMTAETVAPDPRPALKIAVYAICLNEEAFVSRFMASCQGADMVIVADTGSTDGTVAALRAEGAIVHEIAIKPWRFDHARQAALDLVPEDVDICVSLDLDQTLAPGWRGILDRGWKPPANRVYYTLAWAKNHDGSPRNLLDNRIHARHGFVWRYPVHECVVPDGVPEHILVIRHLRIDHGPDPDKSRGQYLHLLQLAASEEPDLPRHAHYLAREYFFIGRYAEAIEEFERHIELQPDQGDVERNNSLRMAAQCRDGLGEPDEALALYRRAVAERPDTRGALVDLAWALYQRELWAECYEAASRAAALPDVVDFYGASSDMGVLAEDMACITGWRLGHFQAALDYGRRAMGLAPNIERIRLNVARMEAALSRNANPAQALGHDAPT
jgi:tetratricopeptide (TPR) repeat protein